MVRKTLTRLIITDEGEIFRYSERKQKVKAKPLGRPRAVPVYESSYETLLARAPRNANAYVDGADMTGRVEYYVQYYQILSKKSKIS